MTALADVVRTIQGNLETDPHFYDDPDHPSFRAKAVPAPSDIPKGMADHLFCSVCGRRMLLRKIGPAWSCEKYDILSDNAHDNIYLNVESLRHFNPRTGESDQ